MSGVWLDHVWDMSGACLGHVWGIIWGIIWGHVWDNIWGILSTMDNNGKQSAVLHASVMPFLMPKLLRSFAFYEHCSLVVWAVSCLIVALVLCLHMYLVVVRNDCCDTAQSDKVTKVAAAKKSSNWNFPTISTASGNVCRSLRKSVFFLRTAIDVSEWQDVLRHLLIVAAQWRYSQPVLAAILPCHISSCGNNNFSQQVFPLGQINISWTVHDNYILCETQKAIW